ncbi:MAG: dCTP deaminase [Myxococcota bacterium]
MCVLTRDEIERELASGRLRIEPFDRDQIGPASIDLHLGHEIRALPRAHDGPIHVLEDTPSPPDTEVIEIDGFYVLEPGQTVLGLTRERLYLPPDLCAWIEGRSRIARLGLTVHVTSGFVQPGVANHQVLELSNVAGVPLALHAGIRVCQIVLERTQGEAVYRGRFVDQDSP